MYSVLSRCSERSTARRMYSLERPDSPGAISTPTLVAMITRSRTCRRRSQLPMTLSDSPPLWPGTQSEYASAVSMKLNPAPMKASSTRKEVGSSAVHPKTLPPRASGPISNPEAPSLRLIMDGKPRCCSGHAIRGRRTGKKAIKILRHAHAHRGARLQGGAAEVREQHDVLQRQQLRWNPGLLLVHVQARTGDRAAAQRLRQCLLVDHFTARGVDQKRRLLHLLQAPGIDEMAVGRPAGTMQGDEV